MVVTKNGDENNSMVSFSLSIKSSLLIPCSFIGFCFFSSSKSIFSGLIIPCSSRRLPAKSGSIPEKYIRRNPVIITVYMLPPFMASLRSVRNSVFSFFPLFSLKKCSVTKMTRSKNSKLIIAVILNNCTEYPRLNTISLIIIQDRPKMSAIFFVLSKT